MILIIAKLFAVAVAFTALHVTPLFAAPVGYVSGTGSDANPCTAAQPCSTFFGPLARVDTGGQISCLNSPAPSESTISTAVSVTIDCAGVYEPSSPNLGGFVLHGVNQAVKIRNLTINGVSGGYPAIKVTGSGTLIIENCAFENMAGPALDIEPNGAFNLVITNSRISNSGAGVLIKPATAGGRVTAAFNGVTIADNTGGGLKTDSTIGGLIEIDVSNSTISNNAGNGMNAVGGAGGSNVLNVGHSVIASNGSAGIQANGGNAAVSVDTTLLDLNNIAISTINNGKVFTYGNSRIIGPSGAGFSAPIALQ
jgi:hypothetical protein